MNDFRRLSLSPWLCVSVRTNTGVKETDRSDSAFNDGYRWPREPCHSRQDKISRRHTVTELPKQPRSPVDGGLIDSATGWRDGVRHSLTYLSVYQYMSGIVGITWGATAGPASRGTLGSTMAGKERWMNDSLQAH